MSQFFDKSFKQAAGLGAVAGLRATMAPAIISHYLSSKNSSGLENSILKFIQSPVSPFITKALSAFEITGDKIPGMADRTITPQLMARIASGAFAGAVVSKANGDNVLKGILVGGIAAVASTYASFYIRKYASKIPYVSDPVLGIAEDFIAMRSGNALMQL